MMQDQDPVIHALLGAGTRYEGKLFFEGRARIDGAFEGEIFSEGVLIIGEEATIKGAIRVHTLIVRGATFGRSGFSWTKASISTARASWARFTIWTISLLRPGRPRILPQMATRTSRKDQPNRT
ncbi:MAG: polymer-forming cytoskeletal protein [Deltaproteobacteria bacterium]|nr:polymer-forming cytoskeletal protein [Deltaproteobacteria bacterium]